MNVEKGLNRLILSLSIVLGIVFFFYMIYSMESDSIKHDYILQPYITLLTICSITLSFISFIIFHIFNKITLWIVEGFTS